MRLKGTDLVPSLFCHLQCPLPKFPLILKEDRAVVICSVAEGEEVGSQTGRDKYLHTC